MAAIGLLSGMQFLMLGIIGGYLGRLYDQSKGRPLFTIREIVGGADGSVGVMKPDSAVPIQMVRPLKYAQST
jgi:dolichol-phosphate mannosyltransferase